MADHRLTRTQADHILGNTTPTLSREEIQARGRATRQETFRNLRAAAKEAANDFGEQMSLEEALANGAPRFGWHTFHIALLTMTMGFWAPVYWLCYRRSARGRYLHNRRQQLRAQGFKV